MQHRWLEEELARRYRDAAPATLALLQERCEGVAAELVAAESRLQAAEDVTSLRRAGDQPFSLMQREHVTLSAASSTPISLPFAAFHARCLSFHREHLLCCSSTQLSMMTLLLLSLSGKHCAVRSAPSNICAVLQQCNMCLQWQIMSQPC